MIYLSIAIIFSAIIFTLKPPTIIFKKIMVIEQATTTTTHTTLTKAEKEAELKDIRDNAPPTLDDIMKSLNESIHQLGGEMVE